MSILVSINNKFESYQKLICFYEEHKNKFFVTIHLEIRNWFAANMCATLGSILDKFTANLNDIKIDYIDNDIETILLKNDFLSYYGKARIIDNNNTTIKFLKLKPTDGKFFKKYVIEELIGRKELPQMSPLLK